MASQREKGEHDEKTSLDLVILMISGISTLLQDLLIISEKNIVTVHGLQLSVHGWKKQKVYKYCTRINCGAENTDLYFTRGWRTMKKSRQSTVNREP